jgi:hypothetical protein
VEGAREGAVGCAGGSAKGRLVIFLELCDEGVDLQVRGEGRGYDWERGGGEAVRDGVFEFGRELLSGCGVED